MTDCSTGIQVTTLAIMFVFVFAVHAVPFAFLFRRWRHRYYWGFLPAVFSSLAYLLAMEQYSPCTTTRMEAFYIMLAVIFYCFTYLSFIYFKPVLSFLWHGETLIPVILSFSFAGAIFAIVWMLLSLGREGLLMEDDQPTAKYRLIETLAHGLIAAIFCTYLAFSLFD